MNTTYYIKVFITFVWVFLFVKCDFSTIEIHILLYFIVQWNLSRYHSISDVIQKLTVIAEPSRGLFSTEQSSVKIFELRLDIP